MEPEVEVGQGPNAHHGPLAPGLRLTASDRPGVAQPVPERDVPPLPWARMLLVAVIVVLMLTAVWEWRARAQGYEVGDLGSEASAWAEQRRRLDEEKPPVAIVGDSRILFDTDLGQFEKLTGFRPVQLSMEGTNARPILQDVADRSSFNGLVIVGITEVSYFRSGIGLGAKALERGKFESPSQRTSFVMGRWLRRNLAFLDNDNALSNLVQRIDRGGRKGAYGPYDDVWKLPVTYDDRQYYLWPEVQRNRFIRDHAIRMWMIIYGFPGPDAKRIKLVQDETAAAVAKIRARGGEVVFVRPPSAPQLRAMENKALPRAKGWDTLLMAARVKGVHFDDMPNAQGLDLPELSHVSKACAPVFTDAYVREIVKATPRLRLLPDAPAPLTPKACA